MDQISLFVSDIATIVRNVSRVPEWAQVLVLIATVLGLLIATYRVTVATVKFTNRSVRFAGRLAYNMVTFFIPKSKPSDQNFLNLMANIESPEAMYDDKEYSFDTGRSVKVYFDEKGKIKKVGVGKDFKYDILPDLNDKEVKLLTRKVAERCIWVRERDRQARRANVPLPSEVALYSGANGPKIEGSLHFDKAAWDELRCSMGSNKSGKTV